MPVQVNSVGGLLVPLPPTASVLVWCVPEWPVINEPSGSERPMRGSSRFTVKLSRTTRHSCACGTVASIDGGQCEPCGYEATSAYQIRENREATRGGGAPYLSCACNLVNV